MSDLIVNEITNLSAEELSPIVTQVLGEDAYPVGPLTLTKIGRSAGRATAGIYLIAGLANGASGEQRWSTVAKVLGDPENPNPSTIDHSPRELDVYRSFVFAEVCGGVRCARFYALQQRNDLQFLWLEDLSAAPQAPWIPSYFVTAARHLGQFNAHWPEESLPEWKWLNDMGVRRYFRNIPIEKAFTRFPEVQDHPLMGCFVQADMARELMHMWHESEPLLTRAEATTKGICHWDCHPKNLFPIQNARDGEYTAAIDWDHVGIGSFGVDVGHLIASPITWMELPLTEAHMLVEPIFNAYLSGLKDSGWSGNEESVRLTYLTRLLFQSVRLTLGVVSAIDDEKWAKTVEKLIGHPIDVICTQWGKELEFQMGYRDEVVRLASQLKGVR